MQETGMGLAKARAGNIALEALVNDRGVVVVLTSFLLCVCLHFAVHECFQHASVVDSGGGDGEAV